MKARSLLLVSLMLATTACGGGRVIEDGGVYTRRALCPQVAIPAATGDVTLFDPAGRTDSASLDVVATITNVRGTCTDDGTTVTSTARFDVVATRGRAADARQVVLPYFNVTMQGGSTVVDKQIASVGLNFAAGAIRAQTSGSATVRVSKAAATLPADVQRELTRNRKPGEADAAIDPLSVPAIRDAVARATFEQLLGFQLTPAQLRYNATR